MTDPLAAAALLAARKSPESETLWLMRCRSNKCWQAGAWQMRGRTVFGVPRIKLSPAMSAELEQPRVLDAQAWLDQAPADPVLIGCDHWLSRAVLTAEGAVLESRQEQQP